MPSRLSTCIALVCALTASISFAGQFGTGFAVNGEGFLVTCHHVIKDANRILVHSHNQTYEAQLVAADPANDLAVIKVDGWPGTFLGMSDADEVTYGSGILVAGFPDPSILGKNPKVTRGFVNAMSGVRDDPRYFQFSAPVQPGNSGGPLVSDTGRVIGVIASGLNSLDRMENGGYLPQSVNYAVKSDIIYPMLARHGIKIPKFGTRTPKSRAIDRSIRAIALIESSNVASRPAPRFTGHDAPARHRPVETFAGPWVFPDSHARPIHPQELAGLPYEALWRARNEIYLRHGFAFTSPRGQNFASQFGSAYRPQTNSIDAIKGRFTSVEIANLQLIYNFEQRAGS